MSDPLSLLARIETALDGSGLRLRGTLNFAPGEGPPLRSGETARSVVLLGNVGRSIWPAFSDWARDYTGSDPLDTWSTQIIRPVADALGATAYFPSDRPWQPFQQWAMLAEGLRPSPLGVLLHPTYGPWHGYRGALGFPFASKKRTGSTASHPCDNCHGKPCLKTCPAAAIGPTPESFAVNRCRSHLLEPQGQVTCGSHGCAARNACPVGTSHRYSPAQLAFHMAALQAPAS